MECDIRSNVFINMTVYNQTYNLVKRKEIFLQTIHFSMLTGIKITFLISNSFMLESLI